MRYNQVFSNIRMVPNFISGHFIQWTIDPFFKGVAPYNFILQVSQTIDFSQLIFEKALGDTFFAVDDSKYKQAWTSNYNYRIVLETGDGTRYVSSVIVFGTNPVEQRKYAMAAEINRKELLLGRYAGHRAWLLKRKSYGSVTQSTVDPISGVSIADERDMDYGVGLDGGYFSPVACNYVIDSFQTDKQLDPQTGLGVKETIDLVARFPGYPAVDNRDIICHFDDGTRYNILAAGVTYFPGTDLPVSQKVSLRAIPPTDTIYNIPLPTELDE